MNSGAIRVIDTSQSLAYILQDESLFFGTGYKVLTGQDKPYFVQCACSLWNGRLKLVYLTRGLVPLSKSACEMNADRLVSALASLVETILDISENGFLSVQNIELNENRIFVDSSLNCGVKIVYVPILQPVSGSDDIGTYRILAEMMLRILSQIKETNSHIKAIVSYLGQGNGNFRSLHGLLKGIDGSSNVSNEPPTQFAGYQLVPLNRPNSQSIDVLSSNMTIGKSGKRSDLALDCSPAISRIHCRLSFANEELYITDEKSANGTFVNGRRLLPASPTLLRVGDEVKLADVIFHVRLKEKA